MHIVIGHWVGLTAIYYTLAAKLPNGRIFIRDKFSTNQFVFIIVGAIYRRWCYWDSNNSNIELKLD